MPFRFRGKKPGVKILDITGHAYGYLTVVRLFARVNGATRWLCRCVCGNEITPPVSRLRSGKVKSCGCKKQEFIAATQFKSSHNGSRTRTYSTWASMLSRCRNPRNSYYHRYGGRGIVVCERWHDFANFLADMGEHPPGKSLDRIDNDGHYEPGNCRWTDRKTQSQNKCDTVFATIDGVTKPVVEWARMYGMPYATAIQRYKRTGSIFPSRR